MTQRALPSSEQPQATLGVAPSLAADPSPGLRPSFPHKQERSLKFDRSLNFVDSKKRLEANNYN